MRRAPARPVLLALALLAPADRAHTEGAMDAAPAPLAVEVAGCSPVAPGNAASAVCELPEDRTLTIFVDAEAGAAAGAGAGADAGAWVTVRAGGGEIAPALKTRVQGGVRLRVAVPAGAEALEVEAWGGAARASIALRAPAAAPAVREAERLRRSGNLEEARRLLEPLAAGGDAAARGAIARIQLQQGEVEAAITSLKEAAARQAEAGRVGDALRDELALAHALLYRARRIGEARAAIARARGVARGWAEGEVRARYYEALVAYETGDVRAALPLLGATAEGSERLGLTSYRAAARPMQAFLLQALGRAREAEAAIEEAIGMAPEIQRACERADLLTNAGWFWLRSLEAAGEAGPRRAGREEHAARAARAAAAWREVLALHAEGGGCPRPEGRAHARTNLALLALGEGRPDEARAELGQARALEGAKGDGRVDPRLAASWLDLEGRLALEGGRGAEGARAALAAYDQLAQLAERAFLPALRPRALLGRARALNALGRGAEAAAAYAAAEEAVEDLGLLVPIHEGRPSFLGHYEEVARRRVGFLLGRDAAAAARAARRARARALSSLQWRERLEAIGALDASARGRWEEALAAFRRGRDALEAAAGAAWALPEDELRRALARRDAEEARLRAGLDEALAGLGLRAPAAGAPEEALADPGPGELMLVFHPVPDGWAGFAITAEGARGRALGPVDASAPPAALAEALLTPFADELAAAARVRLLAYGALDRADLHALPWRGGPLVAALPVAYGLDLPRRAGASATASRARANAKDAARAALVVADPRGDLPAARAEAAAVTAALRGRGGWMVSELAGEAATHRAARAALDRGGIDLLHYAGHGRSAGRDGWESGLPLAGGGALRVSDILALPAAPAEVVLIGCETGRAADSPQGVGLGLAQAFLISGSEAAVAATRPVEDELAAALAEALYAAPPGDAAARLRSAQRAMLAARPDADWASFRVLVP